MTAAWSPRRYTPSCVTAADAVAQGRSAQAYQTALARRTLRPVTIARLILAAAERPRTAPALVSLMRLAPGLAGLLARATRVGH
jgi:menaquinone-9 beta-reductase